MYTLTHVWRYFWPTSRFHFLFLCSYLQNIVLNNKLITFIELYLFIYYISFFCSSQVFVFWKNLVSCKTYYSKMSKLLLQYWICLQKLFLIIIISKSPLKKLTFLGCYIFMTLRGTETAIKRRKDYFFSDQLDLSVSLTSLMKYLNWLFLFHLKCQVE